MVWSGKTSDGGLPGFFFGTCDASPAGAMPYFEDDDDPKKPRPVEARKKGDGPLERGESRKDDDRDDRRHVHVRC